MVKHLDDEQWIDALEGGEGAAHAGTCGECGARLAELRRMLEMSRAADVPEPPPFYWAAFRRQVGRRIEDEPSPRRSGALVVLAGLAAAAGLAAVLLRSPLSETPVPVASGGALPVWSALPDEDPSMGVLESLDAPAGLLLEEAGCGDVAGCLTGLSDDESTHLVALLRLEMAEGGDL